MALKLTDEQKKELERIVTEAKEKNAPLETAIDKADGDTKDALILELQAKQDESESTIATLFGLVDAGKDQEVPTCDQEGPCGRRD